MTYPPKVNPYAVAFYNSGNSHIVPGRLPKVIDKFFIHEFNNRIISINNRAQYSEFTLALLEENGIPQDDGTRKPFKFDEQLVNECGFNERQMEILKYRFCIKGSLKYFSSLDPITDMDKIIVFILGNYPCHINIDTCPRGTGPNNSYELFRVLNKSVEYIITYNYDIEHLREENSLLKLRIKELEEKNKAILDNLAIVNKRMGLTL